MCALALAAALGAQQKSGNPATRLAGDFGADQKRIWTSPSHMSQRQFWTIAVPLAGGTAGLTSLDRRITDSLPQSNDQVTWSGRVSNLGAVYGLPAAAAATAVAGYSFDKPHVTASGRNGLEAALDAMVVVYATKYVFWRERPSEPAAAGASGAAATAFRPDTR